MGGLVAGTGCGLGRIRVDERLRCRARPGKTGKQTRAKRENKPVLLQFTGQKWCALCVVLEKKIFSKKQFLDAASKNWVLVEIDLTRGKLDKMPPDQRAMYERNRGLAKKYKLRSVPTFILLDANGKEFSRFLGEHRWTVESFLKLLDDRLAKKGK